MFRKHGMILHIHGMNVNRLKYKKYDNSIELKINFELAAAHPFWYFIFGPSPMCYTFVLAHKNSGSDLSSMRTNNHHHHRRQYYTLAGDSNRENVFEFSSPIVIVSLHLRLEFQLHVHFLHLLESDFLLCH